jgi:outer membrane protein OmpA-like peptidoglycan-associated protein
MVMGKLPMDLRTSTSWAIANVSSKGVLGGSETKFDLVNVHTARAHRLKVLAGGVGKGLFLVNYSPESSMSNYAYFTTYRPVNFEDFDEIGARITGGSALLYSWSSLTLWDGPAYTSSGLAHARMSGWGVSTPNIGVDHGVASVIYGDGEPVGFPETWPDLDLPPSPEQISTHSEITSKDDSLVIILDGDVLFDFDKSNIKPEAYKPLTQAASVIKSAQTQESSVLINGYTDNVGTDDYNQKLSERRANAVAAWFVSNGYLSDSIIKKQGMGKSSPRASNFDAAGRAKNRRVEIYVINK